MKKDSNNSESDSTKYEKIWHTYSMKRNEKYNVRNLSKRNEMNEINNGTMICSSESDSDIVLNSKDSESNAMINDNMKSTYAMKDNKIIIEWVIIIKIKWLNLITMI